MIQLTKDEEQKIEAEAIAMYPTMEADKFLWYEAERIGYIAGATSRAIKAKEEIEAERAKAKELVEALDKFSTMSEDTGRSGCNYGDTDYDSLSVVYGYNLAVEQIRNEAKQALLNYKP